MRRVFPDSHYWVALLNDQDQGHAAAKAISETLQGVTLVTAEEVLTEVPAFFGGRGRHLRQLVIALVDDVQRRSK